MRFSRFKNQPTIRKGESPADALERLAAGVRPGETALDAFVRRHALRGEAARVGANIPAVPSGTNGRSRTTFQNVFLPGCKIPDGYHPDRMAAPSQDCQKAAIAAGAVLCVTQAGGESLGVAAATFLAGAVVNIVPQDATKFWAMELHVAVFDAGAETRIFNGTASQAVTNGRNQFVSNAIPLTGFSEVMPYLGVTWDGATPSNPYRITIQGVAAGAVDIRVFLSGYAIR